MKINKVIILLLIGCLASTMLVGCSKKSNDNEANSKIENALKNTFGDRGKEESKKDEKDKEQKGDDKKDSGENVPESIKKKSKAKETTTVDPYKCKYCGDTIYYIIEDKEFGINGHICWDCYWDKIMEIMNEAIEEDKPIGECSWCGRDISSYENYNYTEDNQLICSNCYPNYCEWLDENYDDCDDSGEYEEEYHDDECYYCSDCGSKAYYDDDCYPYCWDCYCRHQEEYEVEEYEYTDDDGEDING